MGLPIAVTASIMLSGMLGIRFDASTDGKWNHHFSILPFRPNRPSAMKPSQPPSNPQSPTMPTNTAAVNITAPSIILSSTSPASVGNHVGSLGVAANQTDHSCGPASCKSSEICVTWEKEKDEVLGGRRSRESPLMSHQCLEDDGIHYNKMDPVGAMLCENGQAHSIINKSQPCLRDKPPCPLVWTYKCTSKPSKTHSCKFRNCPSGVPCVEQVTCGLEPPCRTTAICNDLMSLSPD